MKSYKQFVSEAREARAFLAGELPLSQRKKKKVGQKVISKRKSNDLSQRDEASGISPSSDPSPEVDNSNDIHIVGNYLGRPDYSESIEPLVDVMNRLYPAPESKLREDTQLSSISFALILSRCWHGV